MIDMQITIGSEKNQLTSYILSKLEIQIARVEN